jgi:hypothetical protein
MYYNDIAFPSFWNLPFPCGMLTAAKYSSLDRIIASRQQVRQQRRHFLDPNAGCA